MIDRGPAILLTVMAGGFIALQAPINATLGRSVGSLAAATISFFIGTVALVAVTVLVGGGLGDVGEARSLPWYYLLGGVLGAVYVTSALVAVGALGAGGVTAATISGQLTAAIVIDRLGVLGLDERPLTAQRLIGVALLALGTFLVVRE